MSRTSFTLPPDLRTWAQAEAQRRVVSVSELIREALERLRKDAGHEDDPFFQAPVWKGKAPRDGSTRTDKYLAEIES